MADAAFLVAMQELRAVLAMGGKFAADDIDALIEMFLDSFQPSLPTVEDVRAETIRQYGFVLGKLFGGLEL